MPAPSGKVPSKLSVDFSNVGDRSEGGAAAHVPEGDYLLQVVGCELRKKKDDESSKYLSWKLGIAKPEKYKGKGAIYHITTLKEEGLWSLRNFLERYACRLELSDLEQADQVGGSVVFASPKPCGSRQQPALHVVPHRTSRYARPVGELIGAVKRGLGVHFINVTPKYDSYKCRYLSARVPRASPSSA
jgi:hypothetical protein